MNIVAVSLGTAGWFFGVALFVGFFLFLFLKFRRALKRYRENQEREAARERRFTLSFEELLKENLLDSEEIECIPALQNIVNAQDQSIFQQVRIHLHPEDPLTVCIGYTQFNLRVWMDRKELLELLDRRLVCWMTNAVQDYNEPRVVLPPNIVTTIQMIQVLVR